MGSVVLARKWRPNTFDTIVGQPHAVQALTHALTTKRLHHAYLFTGTRGVGKTSIARILAKALCCETDITPNPCGVCLHCQEIETGRFVDLIEIDAASRSKVEDTREILDNVLYAPARGRFKIYLIDEVHMLSGHSFNALLKTLEEPPEHVKFLLATTEPKKLPATVLSRCLQFHLKNISSNEMVAHLSHILQEENIPFEPAALPWIAQAADGSVRDALSLLDQAIAQGQNHVLESNIREMLGYVETYYITQLIDALIEKSGSKILSISADLQRQGTSCTDVLRELQRFFHQIAVIQCVPEYNEHDLYSTKIIKDLAAKISREDLQLFYQIALKGFQDLSLTPTPWIAFEMILLRMLAFQPTTEISVGATGSRPSCELPQKNQESLQPMTQGRPPVAPTEDRSKLTPPTWDTLLPALKLTGIANTAAQHCTFTMLNQDDQHQITINVPAQYSTFLTSSIKKQIEESLKQYFLKNHQQHTTVIFQSAQEPLNSPAAKQQEKEKKILTSTQESFEKDKNLHTILEVFHGTIVPDSIKPHTD